MRAEQANRPKKSDPVTQMNVPFPNFAHAQRSVEPDDAPLPLLGVVVVARDEARHIAACLRGVLAAVEGMGETRVVVVDSDSTDDTAAIAAMFPVEVYRYRSPIRTAAAGRRIGTELVRSRYVLFVDGDCVLEGGWLSGALSRLEADRNLAAVYGSRREVYEGRPDGFVSAASPEETGLGGNALYRRDALVAAGGFHPFLPAEEEGELLGRLRSAGWRVEPTRDLMFTHYTTPKDTVLGHGRRLRRGMTLAPGKVLRVAARDHLLTYHLKRFDRQVVTLVYLLLGVAAVVAVAFGAPVLVLAGWISAGALGFVALWYRRRRLRSAVYIVTEWVLGAAGLALGALRDVPPAERFAPLVERLPAVDPGAAGGLSR